MHHVTSVASSSSASSLAQLTNTRSPSRSDSAPASPRALCSRTSTSCPSSVRTTHCTAEPDHHRRDDRRAERALGRRHCARQPDVLGPHRDDLAGLPDEVRLADEVGDEPRRRPVVDLPRRRELLDPAGVHHRDPVGHGQRLLLVVRHVDERDPDLAPGSASARSGAPGAPSGRGRRAARRGAGLAAASTSARASATRCCWPPESCFGFRPSKPASRTSSSISLARARRSFLPRPAASARTRRSPPRSGAGRARTTGRPCSPRACTAGSRATSCAADPHLAFVRPLEAGDQAQRRRLAAARRPEERQELARMHLEVERVDRHHVAEALRDPDELDVRRRRRRRPQGSVAGWADDPHHLRRASPAFVSR